MKKINSVIDFAFKDTNQSKISNHNYIIANWCKSSKSFVFEMNSLKIAVEYLIINSSFSIGDQIFQQIIGVSMGWDPWSFFTNLFFFFHYEWQYMNKFKKENVISAQKFCYILRFIDDLITINNENFVHIHSILYIMLILNILTYGSFV